MTGRVPDPAFPLRGDEAVPWFEALLLDRETRCRHAFSTRRGDRNRLSEALDLPRPP